MKTYFASFANIITFAAPSKNYFHNITTKETDILKTLTNSNSSSKGLKCQTKIPTGVIVPKGKNWKN